MQKYLEYILDKLQTLLAIDSPSGYTRAATDYLLKELAAMGLAPRRTEKGSVIVELGGESTTGEGALLLSAHCDTLGGMVREIKANGRLRLAPIGGMRAENAETENCRIVTKSGKVYEGTCQLLNASVHINLEYDVKRTWENVEIVIDEPVSTKEETKALGIANGDYVCFEPRTRITKSGYIKSRFLDDKLSLCILLGYAKRVTEEKIKLPRKVYLYFSVFEEVGHHGAAASLPGDVTEAWAVDMGCVGDGLECTEREVSICAKDSGGPFHQDVVNRQVRVAERLGLRYAVDVYHGYTSDVAVMLQAGLEARFGLVGPGVYASHGYERSHVDGVKNTFALICGYIEDPE